MTQQDKDCEDFQKELDAENVALRTMMEKGDAVSWPEARPYYMQRFNGWIKDGHPHDLIKMLDRMQAELEAARDHYMPKLTEKQAIEKAAVALYNLEHKTKLDKVAEFESYWRDNAKTALRAAGVRFKEEV
jgi:hypothetical protein